LIVVVVVDDVVVVVTVLMPHHVPQRPLPSAQDVAGEGVAAYS
jgi:hypothetical protein